MCGCKATLLLKHAIESTCPEEHWVVFQRYVGEGLRRVGCEHIAVVPPVHPAATLREGHTHGGVGVDGGHQNVLAQQVVECVWIEVIYQLHKRTLWQNLSTTQVYSPQASLYHTHCLHLQPLIICAWQLFTFNTTGRLPSQ